MSTASTAQVSGAEAILTLPAPQVLGARLVPPAPRILETGAVAPEALGLPGGPADAAKAIRSGKDKLSDYLITTFNNVPPTDPIIAGPNNLDTLIEKRILEPSTGARLTRTEFMNRINGLLASPELADSPAVKQYDGLLAQAAYNYLLMSALTSLMEANAHLNVGCAIRYQSILDKDGRPDADAVHLITELSKSQSLKLRISVPESRYDEAVKALSGLPAGFLTTIESVDGLKKEMGAERVVFVASDAKEGGTAQIEDYLSAQPPAGYQNDRFAVINADSTNPQVNAVIAAIVVASKDENMHFIGYADKTQLGARLAPLMTMIQKMPGILFRIVKDPWGALQDAWITLKAVTASQLPQDKTLPG